MIPDKVEITVSDFRKAIVLEGIKWAKTGSSVIISDSPYKVQLVSGLRIHELAFENPMMNDEQFQALKESIATDGQLEAILIYRGKVIDGRNRIKALKELGIEFVLYEDLPNNTTLEDVRGIAMKKELRRHETKAQLAIRAYRLMIRDSIKAKDAALLVGSSAADISKIKRVVNALGVNIINDFFENSSVILPDRTRATNITKLVSYVVELEKKQKDEKNKAGSVSYGFSTEINTDLEEAIRAVVQLSSHGNTQALMNVIIASKNNIYKITEAM